MTTPTHILIVNRDAAAGEALQQTLSEQGYAAARVDTGKDALAELDRRRAQPDAAPIGVVIADQDAAGPESGLGLIRRLHDDWPLVVPVMVSGFRKLESAVQAMRLGAADYLLKPVVQAELIEAVQRATQRHLLRVEHETAQQDVADVNTDLSPKRRADDAPPDQDTANNDNAWQPIPLSQAMKEPERQILLAALEANDWNRQQTAKDLDINRTTLYKKIRLYRLDEPA